MLDHGYRTHSMKFRLEAYDTEEGACVGASVLLAPALIASSRRRRSGMTLRDNVRNTELAARVLIDVLVRYSTTIAQYDSWTILRPNKLNVGVVRWTIIMP